MKEPKICPLLAIAGSTQGINSTALCQEKGCAWWIRKMDPVFKDLEVGGECALVGLVHSLKRIEGCL